MVEYFQTSVSLCNITSRNILDLIKRCLRKIFNMITERYSMKLENIFTVITRRISFCIKILIILLPLHKTNLEKK